MKTYVSAKFETEDFADIALGRLKRFCSCGAKGSRIILSRENGSDNNGDDGYKLYYPYLNSVFYSVYPWPAFLEPRFILDSRRRDSFDSNFKNEPLRRLDCLLEVSAATDLAARCVSEILVNAGGRNIRTVQK